MWPHFPRFSLHLYFHSLIRIMATVAPAFHAHQNPVAGDTVGQDTIVPGKDPLGATEATQSQATGGRNYVKKSMEEKQSKNIWKGLIS